MHSGLWVLGCSVPLSPGILAACTLSDLHPTPHVGPCPRVSGPTSQFQVPPRLWTPAAHSWVSSLCEPIHLVPAPLCPIHAWLWASCTPSAHVSKTVCALSCPFQEQLRRGQQAHSGVWPKANANPGIAGTGRQRGRGGGWPWGGGVGTLGLGARDQSLPYTVHVPDRLPAGVAVRTFQTPPPSPPFPAGKGGGNPAARIVPLSSEQGPGVPGQGWGQRLLGGVPSLEAADPWPLGRPSLHLGAVGPTGRWAPHSGTPSPSGSFWSWPRSASIVSLLVSGVGRECACDLFLPRGFPTSLGSPL